MAENNDATFRLIKSSRGGNKLEENGFLFDKDEILGEIKKKRVQSETSYTRYGNNKTNQSDSLSGN